MEIGEEMAFRREIKFHSGKWVIWRGVVLTLLAFFSLAHFTAFAEPPPKPVLTETKWRTGEIEICWANVKAGNMLTLYLRTFKQTTYIAHDSWIAETSAGCYMTQFYENGQTVWHYVKAYDQDTDTWSEASEEARQTPPITAYIVNWPDMFNQLTDLMTGLNDDMKNHLDKLFTPSDQAVNDLKNAVDGLKNSVGVGTVNQIGNDLQTALQGAQNGMRPPAVTDDGVGTYTGGSTGGKLPFEPKTNGMGLSAPDPDSGEETEYTIRFPYMVDMQGQLKYFKIFTKEQMEKIKWFGFLREIAGNVIWVMSGFYMLRRFAPQFKA